MSVTTELSRIQADRNTIRAKLVELGMATSVDNLTKLASAIESLVNQGAVQINVKEGETYTIPAGYHNGSGTVSGVAGGGNYSLQSKTATPTKKQQNVTPDSGYYGISDVTIAPIPDAYQDVSSVTTTAPDVLTGKIFVTSDGTVVTGTMTNVGKATKTLDVTAISYTIPKGYHNGTGTVTITLEEKTVTPTKSKQAITPTSGKVLSKVTVNAIPDKYQDVSGVTAADYQVLEGAKFVDSTGALVEGTIPQNEVVEVTLDRSKTTYQIPEGYYPGGGSIGIVVNGHEATPTKSEQVLHPSDGQVWGTFVVNPIPDEYITTDDADAAAGHILLNKTAYVDGEKVTGSMPNNGATSLSIDGITTTSATIPAGYTSGGTVSLTSDIEEALAAI